MSQQAQPPPRSAAQTALAEIGAHARLSNLARVSQLAAALTKLGQGELSMRERQLCGQLAHQLVGSAGTFGFARVSELGRQVELFFASGAFDDPVQVGAAMRAVTDMQQDLSATAAVDHLS